MTPGIDWDGVPDGLLRIERWLPWRAEERDGKRTKVPLRAAEPTRRADVTDSSAWGTAEQVRAVIEAGLADGAGFAFNGDGLGGVDLDGYRDPATGELDPLARDAVRRLHSYAEVSPSGSGLHILVWAPDTRFERKKYPDLNIELYTEARFFTVTGRSLNGSRIADCSTELAAWWQEVGDLDADNKLLAKARRAANGAKFVALYDEGDHSGYASQSEADLALCSMLAYWADSDRERVDRLFRRSALMDEKWERQSYREPTLDKALEGQRGGLLTASGTVAAGRRLTDLGNAERLVARHGLDLRYCPAWRQWLVWDGRRWAPDDLGKTVELAKETVRSILQEAAAETDDERRKLLTKHAAGSESVRSLRAMLALAESAPGIPIRPEDLDTDPWLLNVRNGTIDLRTGTLRPHRREDLIAKLADVDYVPDAPCPRWLRFQEEIMPDAAVRAFVHRYAGYSITGDVSEEVMAFLHGDGANGKSVLLRAIKRTLGDYAADAAPDLLTVKREQDAASLAAVADLRGCRMVTTTETDEGKRLAESLVKLVTGERELKSKLMFQNFFDFVNVSKIWFAANHKPAIRGRDRGIWRRILLVPFGVTFYTDDEPGEPKRDPHLDQTLDAEREGILAWLVQGCLDWQRGGLRPPEAVLAATSEYKDETDPIREWLEDCCVLREGAETNRAVVRKSYTEWCDRTKAHPLGDNKFTRALKEHGVKEGRKSGNDRFWDGIEVISGTLFPRPGGRS